MQFLDAASFEQFSFVLTRVSRIISVGIAAIMEDTAFAMKSTVQG